MRSTLSTRLLHEIRLREFFQPGDRVAVAVSGGADSVALLHLLLELRVKLGIVLSVAHFNHELRGRASEADEKFVATLAAKNHLAFHGDRASVATTAKRDRANLEDAARRARYAFFNQLVCDNRAMKIAVAHTIDDQAETVLAHILRGTGLAGLGGIHPVNGNIVRPLLCFRRAELRCYLLARKQAWREDATNQDTTKTRARIRRRLIPLLEKSFQPAVVRHLASLAELARDDEAFLQSQTALRSTILVDRTNGSLSVSISGLLRRRSKKVRGSLPPLVKSGNRSMSKRLIRAVLEEVKPRAGELGAAHVQSVLQLAETGKSGKSLRLPAGIEVRRENDTLVFSAHRLESPRANGRPNFACHIDLAALRRQPGPVLNVPYLATSLRFSLIDWPPERGETRDISSVLDRDALHPPLVLRSWRPGDRFRPGGHRSAHKLKRLFNRARIPRFNRVGWPVLTSGGVLAWARGFPVAAEFAASERTRVGILIAEEKLS